MKKPIVIAKEVSLRRSCHCERSEAIFPSGKIIPKGRLLQSPPRRVLRNDLAFFAYFLLLSATIFAAPPAGRYEVQSVDGKRLGEMMVTVAPASFSNQPATRVEIKTMLDSDEKVPAETDEAFVDAKGLAYFKRTARAEGKTVNLEGTRDPEKILIRQTINGEKSGFGISLKGLDLSEYEMDLPKSPLSNMVLGQRRALTVFSVNDLAAVPLVRLVKDKKEVNFGGKTIEVFVADTSIGGKVYTSWFEVKSHRLIFERQPDRILQRLEK